MKYRIYTLQPIQPWINSKENLSFKATDFKGTSSLVGISFPPVDQSFDTTEQNFSTHFKKPIQRSEQISWKLTTELIPFDVQQVFGV